MINAEFVPFENETYLVRYSKPDESFEKAKFTPVKSQREVERQVYFKNRRYIVTTILSWINQRTHALKNESSEVKRVRIWLNSYHNTSLFNICIYITKSEKTLLSIAPSKDSKCFEYFNKTIIPIICFCTGENLAPTKCNPNNH